jgi:Zn-dependent peptidase ImmA (M78 family)
MNYKAQPRSREELRNLATKIRNAMGLEKILYFPIMEFVEKALYLIYPEKYSFEVVDKGELGDLEGLTQPDKKIIMIRSDVYDNACQGSGRDRFTIAHEVGHLLLHKETNVTLARGKVITYCDPEWQADAFAGELLMPHKLIANLEINEIMKKCGVTYSAALTQKNK